jgi:ribosome-associated heat shock protein Hsp15
LVGRVEVKGMAAKPARDVRVGEMLRVRNEGGEFEIEVLGLSEVRGPAAVAQALYRETEASKAARAKAAAERKAMGQFDVLRTPGRPSKRDRRLIHRFREGG